MKKSVYCLSSIFLVLFSLLFCSCGSKKTSEPKQNTQIILGFSQIGNESSWRICNSESIKKAAEAHNIQLIYDEAQQKQENQIKAIRSFIVYQVDAIAFVPIVEEGWDSVLKEAKEAGIPVIIVDRKIKTNDRSLYAGYIGEDTLEEGRNAARFLLDKYSETTDTLNILELSGTENSSPAMERAKGFREILKNDSRFNIVYSESGDFLRSRGKEIVSQIITYNEAFSIGNKKIDIIFSHNDAMTLGAIDALEENNINPGVDVTIVSIDGEQKAINALMQGKINCELECNPKIGNQLMILVKEVLKGNPIQDNTFVEETVFTEKDNLTGILPRGY